MNTGVMINLGCGSTNKKDGYINIDKDEGVSPDIIWDITIIPWIWAKMNWAERIEMNNVVEHIESLIRVIQECHWALKNGGILWIKSPFIDTENLDKFLNSILDVFSDPTHKQIFTTRTFDYFDMNHSRWQKFGRSYGIPKFKRIKQEIKDRFLIVELEAIK